MRDRITSGLLVAAALCCAAATVLPWRARGPTSALTPVELARAALAGGFGDVVPRGVGLVALAPALACAVLVGSVAWAGGRRWGGLVAALLCAVPVVALVVLPGPARLAPGGLLLLGALVASLGVVAVSGGRRSASSARAGCPNDLGRT